MWKRVGRKVRSDKKRHVNPTIDVKLKNRIETLAYIVDSPIKEVAERLTILAMSDMDVIILLSEHFKRGILKMDSSLFYGHVDNISVPENKGVNTSRVSIRFKAVNYESIVKYSNLLDVTPSKTTATLLLFAMRNERIVRNIISVYGRSVKNFEKEMKELNKFINKGI